MRKSLERQVRKRATETCEYCRLPQSVSDLPHVVDHVIAQQQGGKSTADNLALACSRCNLHKGPNVAGIDPLTKQLVRLFHPRTDTWGEHFRWEGASLAGLTKVGRATIVVLAMNHPYRLAAREALLAAGKIRLS